MIRPKLKPDALTGRLKWNCDVLTLYWRAVWTFKGNCSVKEVAQAMAEQFGHPADRVRTSGALSLLAARRKIYRVRSGVYVHAEHLDIFT